MSSTPTPTPDNDLPPLSDYFTTASIRLVTPIESFLEGHVTELYLPDNYATFSSHSTNNYDVSNSSKVGVFLGMLLCKWDNCIGPHIEHFWRAHIPDIVIYPVAANLNEQSVADDSSLDASRLSVSTLVETRSESSNHEERRDTLKSELARAFACAHDPTFLKRVATVSLTSHVENTPHEPPLERLLENYSALNASWMSRSGRGRAPSIKSFHFPERRVSLASFIFHSGSPAPTQSARAAANGVHNPPEDSSSSLYSLSVLYHTILPRPLCAPLFSQNGRHNAGASEYEFHVFIQSLLESVFTWLLPCIALSEPKMERELLLDYFCHVACTVAQLLNALTRYNLFDTTLASSCPSPSSTLAASANASGTAPTLTGDELEDAVADASVQVARTLLERSAFLQSAAFLGAGTGTSGASSANGRAFLEFLARAIAAHLVTSGRTLVIGRQRAQVEALVHALALFLTPDELRYSCIVPAPPSARKRDAKLSKTPQTLTRPQAHSPASAQPTPTPISTPASMPPTLNQRSIAGSFAQHGVSKFFDWRAFCLLVGIVLPEEMAQNQASLWSTPGANLDSVALSSFVYSSHLPLTIINVDFRAVQHSELTPQFQRRRINLLGLIERVLLDSASADFAAPSPSPAPTYTYSSAPTTESASQAGAVADSKKEKENEPLNILPFTGPASGALFLQLPAQASACIQTPASTRAATAQIDTCDASAISHASSWDSRMASLLKLAVAQDRSVGVLLNHVTEPNRIVSGFLDQLLDILSARGSHRAPSLSSAASSGDSSLVSSASSSSLTSFANISAAAAGAEPHSSLVAHEDALINALEWIDMFRVDLEARARLLQELLSTREEKLWQLWSREQKDKANKDTSQRVNNALQDVFAREQSAARERIGGERLYSVAPGEQPAPGVGSPPSSSASASSAALAELLQRTLCIESQFELALVCATLARVPDGLHTLSGCAI